MLDTYRTVDFVDTQRLEALCRRVFVVYSDKDKAYPTSAMPDEMAVMDRRAFACALRLFTHPSETPLV